MSIPDTPYTRKEAYLNAIATGDSSGIPEMPYTREEMYLDAIAKGAGGGGGGGSSTLSGLTDVDISNPTDGQTLTYNATSGKWENAPPSTLHVRSVYDESTGDIILSETWQRIYDAISEGVFVYISDSSESEIEQVRAAYQDMVITAMYMDNTYTITSKGEMTGRYVAAAPNEYPRNSGG